jgi:hypothetical protein
MFAARFSRRSPAVSVARLLEQADRRCPANRSAIPRQDLAKVATTFGRRIPFRLRSKRTTEALYGKIPFSERVVRVVVVTRIRSFS